MYEYVYKKVILKIEIEIVVIKIFYIYKYLIENVFEFI